MDSCCYNRPFDDLTSDKVRLEAEAVLIIQNRIANGEFKLFTSLVVDYELGKTRDERKKSRTLAFYRAASAETLGFCDAIEEAADGLEKQGVKYMDALHIAYCNFYKLDYMLTTDKILINAAWRSGVSTRVLNPLSFIEEVLQ